MKTVSSSAESSRRRAGEVARLLALSEHRQRASRSAPRKAHPASGFTLLELLTVIAIIGILAAIALPNLKSFKPNYTASATRQLLDAISRGRQLALSQRTTVYLAFVPPEFTEYDLAYKNALDKSLFQPVLNKQGVGYNFVTLRSLGDQPGRPTARYLDKWKTLPEGAFIPRLKLLSGPNQYIQIRTNGVLAYTVYGFPTYNQIPFPTEQAPATGSSWVNLPYIAFDYLGRLVTLDASGQPVFGRDEIIPLAKGNMVFPRDPVTKAAISGMPSYIEDPVGNWTNTYNLVYIDALTGRAHVERQEIQ